MIPHTFDTSFIIANKLSEFPDNFYLSDVVQLEFIGSARDEEKLKALQTVRRIYARDDLLITPNADDWEMAGKILFWLEQGAKKVNQGKSVPKIPGATQRMALDALIATNARRYKVTVVTENYDHFNAMKYYCDFKLMRGAEFLERFESKLKNK